MICKSSKLMFSDLQRTWGMKLVMMHLVLRATEAFQLHVLFLYVCVCVCVGGAYIPPARLRMMQQSITDKSR